LTEQVKQGEPNQPYKRSKIDQIPLKNRENRSVFPGQKDVVLRITIVKFVKNQNQKSMIICNIFFIPPILLSRESLDVTIPRIASNRVPSVVTAKNKTNKS